MNAASVVGMKTIEEMLRNLGRPEVLEFGLVSDRLPSVNIGGRFEPVDDRAPSTDAVLEMLVAMGGSRYVESLGAKPTQWTARLDGVGVIAIAAIMRDGIVQARFTVARRDPPGAAAKSSTRNPSVPQHAPAPAAAPAPAKPVKPAIEFDGDDEPTVQTVVPPSARSPELAAAMDIVRPPDDDDIPRPKPARTPAQAAAERTASSPALNAVVPPKSAVHAQHHPSAAKAQPAQPKPAAAPAPAPQPAPVVARAPQPAAQPPPAQPPPLIRPQSQPDTKNLPREDPPESGRTVQTGPQRILTPTALDALEVMRNAPPSAAREPSPAPPPAKVTVSVQSEAEANDPTMDVRSQIALNDERTPNVDDAASTVTMNAPPSAVAKVPPSGVAKAAAPVAQEPPSRAEPVHVDTAATASRIDWTGIEPHLAQAVSVKASDLHLVAGRPPLFRIASDLLPNGAALPPADVEKLVGHIVPTRLWPRLDEEGAVDFALDHRAHGRFRANVTRQRTGYKISLRLIPRDVPTLESLALPQSIAGATKHHQGLIVVTGPTGHGKTTTLAAIVDIINSNTANHIITVEDPVEFVHPKKRAMMSQREVGTHTKSFMSALKASLREDPDVIVVGELRDVETVRMAVSASETGHLVLGTMNTPSAAKTIDRIIDMFPPADQQQARVTLAGGLRLIVSQKLVPSADRKGLHAAVELLPGSVALYSLIRDGKTFQIPSLQQRGKALGIIRLDDSLADLVRAGKTTLDAARPFAESPQELEAALTGKAQAPQPAPSKPQEGGGIFGRGLFGGKKG